MAKTKARFTKADRMPPKRTGIEQFYLGLLSAGISLQVVDGDRIAIYAPQNNVSPVLKQAIEKRRAALLPLLRDRQPEEVEW